MILAIDTASPLQSVALAQGDDVLVSASRERFWAEGLLVEVRTLLAQHQASVQDLSSIVAVRGPGSFTGIRIGLAIALGLHQSLAIPAGAVSTHDLLGMAAADPALPEGRGLAVVDALRGWWFVREISHAPSLQCEGEAEGIRRVRQEEIAALGVEFCLGFGAPSIASIPGFEPGPLAPHAVELVRGPKPPRAALNPTALSAPLYLQKPELMRASRTPSRAEGAGNVVGTTPSGEASAGARKERR